MKVGIAAGGGAANQEAECAHGIWLEMLPVIVNICLR